MPPTPSLRCSPMRERRMENSHKRGRSLESGLLLRAKDDDLALFSDLHNKERDNFLLHTSDDVDDSISKLRHSSNLKLGISRITIPARGESIDILNVDGEKNDYNWLLTPPDTPLFSSLDDEERRPVNPLPRGRPRSQPVLISRSSMSERTHRTNRSSASPHRLSKSPGSSNSLIPSRGRPSSVPRASPPPSLRPTTPSRRPSTPPNKPSTPTPRPSTPTVRRMSTGSNGQTSAYGIRGASPVRTTRGSSASPKSRGWQVNLDGFSSDVPPNLRTSLSDRPTAYMRSSSPSSRNGRDRDSSSKYGKSISPTASRSASSSNSHERDRLSTYSKGSVASSCDDDLDSLHSVGISSTLATRRNGAVVNSKAILVSKKPSRTVSASSAPKRSFEYALRQMDHRRTPQNMFRPLLSSVPAATFYVGKSNNTHRPMFSRNSSLTTSSNASSEIGASVAHDIEGSEHDQHDPSGEWVRVQVPNIQEEIFAFDKVDEINVDDGHEISSGKPQKSDENFDIALTNEVSSLEVDNSTSNFGDATQVATACESSYVAGGNEMKTCSRCGSKFWTMDVIKSSEICPECTEEDRFFNLGKPRTTLRVIQDGTVHPDLAIEMDGLYSDMETKIHVSEFPTKNNRQVMLDQDERNYKHGLECAPDSCPPQLVFNQKEQSHSAQQLEKQQEINTIQSKSQAHQSSQLAFTPTHKIDRPEGTGISVLLQKSSSSKWPIVQGRTLSATNIFSSESSYARDNSSSMKHSISLDSVSASSVDLGSDRQTEDRVQHQLSIKKLEMDNLVNDIDAKAQNIALHNKVSIDTCETVFHTESEIDQNFSSSAEDVEYEAFWETGLSTEACDKFQEKEKLCAAKSLFIKVICSDVSIHPDSCLEISDSQFLNHSETFHSVDTSRANKQNDEDCSSCVSAEEVLSENSHKVGLDMEGPKSISVIEEKYMLNGTLLNDSSNDTRNSSTVILELGNESCSFLVTQTECVPSENPSCILEPSISSERGTMISALGSSIVDHALEERTVTVERPRGHMSRSLTLEEATDTILFCSSIIHDVAYKAAAIGMEKELIMQEASRPLPTISGNSVFNQMELRKSSNRSSPNTKKFKRKRVETQTKAKEPEGDAKLEESTHLKAEVPVKAESAQPPKLESKCNCKIM